MGCRSAEGDASPLPLARIYALRGAPCSTIRQAARPTGAPSSAPRAVGPSVPVHRPAPRRIIRSCSAPCRRRGGRGGGGGRGGARAQCSVVRACVRVTCRERHGRTTSHCACLLLALGGDGCPAEGDTASPQAQRKARARARARAEEQRLGRAVSNNEKWPSPPTRHDGGDGTVTVRTLRRAKSQYDTTVSRRARRTSQAA